MCECFCEEAICSNAGQFGKKSFSVAIAVGPIPTGQQRQSLTAVATQVPGSLKPYRLQKEQGEQQIAQGCRSAMSDT